MRNVHGQRHVVQTRVVGVCRGICVVVVGGFVHATEHVRRGGACGAGFPAHGLEHGFCIKRQRTVREPVNRGRAGFAAGEFFLVVPAVQGELVFHRAGHQWQSHGPHAVTVGVVHGVATAAPAVEAAVDEHAAVRIRFRVLVHVHLERDVHGINLVGARRTAAVRVVGRRTGRNLTVGVPRVIRHRCTIASVLHVVDELLLIGKAVNGVLVFDIACRKVQRHRVHAVAVVVRELVPSVVRSPARKGTRHEDLVKRRRAVQHRSRVCCTAHVHVEGRRIQTLSVVFENVVRTVVACSGVGATGARRAVAVAHTATVYVADAVVHVVTNAVAVSVHAGAPAHAARVKLVAIAIASAFRNAVAVAHAARVVLAHAIVHVVANAVAVCIFRTFTAALAQRVHLVSEAVAIAVGNARTAANAAFVVHRTRTVIDGGRAVVVAR